MENILCKLCRCRFLPEHDKFPKVLNCGHSICSSCVKTASKCPFCDVDLLPVNPIHLLTNFQLLEVSTALLHPYDAKNNMFITCLKIITNLFISVDQALQRVNLQMSTFEMRPYDSRFNKLMDTPRKLFSEIKSKAALFYDKFFPKYSFQVIEIMHLESEECILQIMTKLSKGINIYVASCIDEQMKFGKVSLKTNGILINSLTLAEKPERAVFIWLNEFKEKFEDQLCSFLTLSTNKKSSDGNTYTLFFDIAESQRNSGFLELCTGEIKHGFKDSPYSTGNDSFIINLNPLNYMTLHCGNDNLQIVKDEIILRFISSTQCEIKRIKVPSDLYQVASKSIVGKLRHDVRFENLNALTTADQKIKECGIVVFKYYANMFYAILDQGNVIIITEERNNAERMVKQGNVEIRREQGITDLLSEQGNENRMREQGNTNREVEQGNAERIREQSNVERIREQADRVLEQDKVERVIEKDNVGRTREQGNTYQVVEQGNVEMTREQDNAKRMREHGKTDRVMEQGNVETKEQDNVKRMREDNVKRMREDNV